MALHNALKVGHAKIQPTQFYSATVCEDMLIYQ